MTFLLYSSSLLLVLFSCFPARSQGLQSHFHISSLLPHPVCRRHPTAGDVDFFSSLHFLHVHNNCSKEKASSTSTLELVHRLSPCLAHNNNNNTPNKPILSSLAHDQLRVDSIKANLPTQSGRQLYHTGNYIVNISLGTPVQQASLILDTGSDLTWTRCQPCTSDTCPIFDPTVSSTYYNISCDKPLCFNMLPRKTCDLLRRCTYSVVYGDGSYSVGLFSLEKLTIPETGDVFPDFMFGCGQSNYGFGEASGILGFGRNETSFLSQIKETYGSYFSYCFPSTSDMIGFLTLGQNQDSTNSNMNFTPLSTRPDYPSFYFVEITSISVGGTQLAIDYPSLFKNPGTIIDSGTVISRVPQDAYTAMRDEFKRMIMGNYTAAKTFTIFDTCFYASQGMIVPIVSFTFRGNVTVDLGAPQVLIALDGTIACFAFVPNDVSILGNTQQKTLEVVYDVAGGQLGFRPNACS
ncbi:aspartic proteinase nepenthesin-2 [Phtheirospermum japonicum]|uniref:Aspartic proteinase nepenthesin-2 n=1 Tax=Phtheirospermum japonicum TaxID=374723 RepID=A0A830BA21_9LAMI|nr:aspartic proteinase nepenthesin-2 [Phtheirospermum japonicum]